MKKIFLSLLLIIFLISSANAKLILIKQNKSNIAPWIFNSLRQLVKSKILITTPLERNNIFAKHPNFNRYEIAELMAKVLAVKDNNSLNFNLITKNDRFTITKLVEEFNIELEEMGIKTKSLANNNLGMDFSKNKYFALKFGKENKIYDQVVKNMKIN